MRFNGNDKQARSENASSGSCFSKKTNVTAHLQLFFNILILSWDDLRKTCFLVLDFRLTYDMHNNL